MMQIKIDDLTGPEIAELLQEHLRNMAATYAFQARAQTNSGYTDWSESVTRICT
jgi:hypothetical protein